MHDSGLVLYVSPREVSTNSRGEVRIILSVNEDRAFCAEFVMFVRISGEVIRCFRVFDAQRLGGRKAVVSATEVDIDGGTGPAGVTNVAYGVAHLPGVFIRDADGAKAALDVKKGWERRYRKYATRNGYAPVPPIPEVRAWTRAYPASWQLVALGDGDGRVGRNLCDELSVLSIDLSATALSIAAGRARGDLECLTGDVIRWCHARGLSDPCLVVMLYVGPFSDDEWEVLGDFLQRTIASGGACFLEFARASMDERRQLWFEQELTLAGRVFRRHADDIERIRFTSGGVGLGRP